MPSIPIRGLDHERFDLRRERGDREACEWFELTIGGVMRDERVPQRITQGLDDVGKVVVRAYGAHEAESGDVVADESIRSATISAALRSAIAAHECVEVRGGEADIVTLRTFLGNLDVLGLEFRCAFKRRERHEPDVIVSLSNWRRYEYRMLPNGGYLLLRGAATLPQVQKFSGSAAAADDGFYDLLPPALIPRAPALIRDALSVLEDLAERYEGLFPEEASRIRARTQEVTAWSGNPARQEASIQATAAFLDEMAAAPGLRLAPACRSVAESLRREMARRMAWRLPTESTEDTASKDQPDVDREPRPGISLEP